ncbi:MAG: GNAT family N-acetyltransferase [Armatimonadota bacterium]
MSELPTSPQLHMLRPHLHDLPAFALPEGYGLRTFREGDGEHWVRIIAESFNTDPATLSFEKTMRESPAFRPERIFFITGGGEPVATASAYEDPEFMADAGMVHYVGVLNGHAGKRLGYWIVLATLEQMAREGHRRAWLSTDDFRLPAIKTYLNLGFEPLLIHENQRERWPAVFNKLGLPELTARFNQTIRGPLWPAQAAPG